MSFKSTPIRQFKK